ncbi:MAG: LemA family protein [Candidatus Omnitrophica bacterium]|nr:LemA family protein [Candidatus Omnitrophota bacterium]
MKKTLLITLGVILALVVLFFMIFGGVYNKLVAAEEGVSSAWAQVENVYQRRADLVPNLVNTVKGFAAQEKDVLQGVVEARSKVSQMNINASDILNDPAALQQFQAVQGQLSSALSRLLVTVVRYPELKSSQNFLTLQTQLEGTENRITVERRRFNDAAKGFNTFRRQFPNNLIAGMMGFKSKEYFQADQGADKAPVVQF